MNRKNYSNILSMIEENYSQQAIKDLSENDRRQLAIFRTSRCLYNLYVSIAGLKNYLLGK